MSKNKASVANEYALSLLNEKQEAEGCALPPYVITANHPSFPYLVGYATQLCTDLSEPYVYEALYKADLIAVIAHPNEIPCGILSGRRVKHYFEIDIICSRKRVGWYLFQVAIRYCLDHKIHMISLLSVPKSVNTYRRWGLKETAVGVSIGDVRRGYRRFLY
jgi:hypothetical protein